ncbi:hypothetical protein GCM10010218_62840 [Streptomyces mashuensis]|uniref:CHRD domain-containing protein n=1 Tax=Streptomyces mashuensis TaxID=33904 RepID=A0A919B9P6_9ACTN|nr:CHRD domain-containing protein [Streptomyces mashuensis]GHF73064.1 hypothetical protein GCM10010218_62840 [Streptomyces mashuensis]
MKRKALAVGAAAVVVAAAAAGTALAVLPDDAAGGDRSGAETVFFAGSMSGDQEVPTPGGPAVGDKDGRALVFLRVRGDEVAYAFTFRGIATPTAGHVHQGGRGKNGDVKIPFFMSSASSAPSAPSTSKLPDGRTSVTGTVKVPDRELLASLTSAPGGFYANLHTGEFPGGAVRGQLHRLAAPVDMDTVARRGFQASVVRGSQVYACVKQPDGSAAFTQENVSAALGGNIAHSFVRPGGAPQWKAPDGSAVTGEVTDKAPNGAGNIPELDLKATRSGADKGLLADTREVLRLNTRGGVAPAGTCTPGQRAAVPYTADYVFVP